MLSKIHFLWDDILIPVSRSLLVNYRMVNMNIE